jgi:DNA-binding MarR family transcriptional regulator
MALGRRLREHLEETLRVENIGLRHYSALGHLAREPGVSYSELARRAHVTPQSMQATLTRLEQLGAVDRVGKAGRGRTAHLRVTDEGHRLLDVGRRAFSRVDEALAQELGAEANGRFLESVDTVFRNEPWQPHRRKQEP